MSEMTEKHKFGETIEGGLTLIMLIACRATTTTTTTMTGGHTVVNKTKCCYYSGNKEIYTW